MVDVAVFVRFISWGYISLLAGSLCSDISLDHTHGTRALQKSAAKYSPGGNDILAPRA
jgi:hypothetical protein